MSSDTKVSQKIPKGGVKNGELIPKTWKKGGNNEAKMKALGRNNEKGYQKPPRHFVTLGARLHIEHL
jgi:hypothetical protein